MLFLIIIFNEIYWMELNYYKNQKFNYTPVLVINDDEGHVNPYRRSLDWVVSCGSLSINSKTNPLIFFVK